MKALDKTRKKTESKIKCIRSRLKDGFTTKQLKTVIDRVFSNYFMLGKNDRNKQYIEIDNFFRNVEQVEKWLNDTPKQMKSNTFKSAAYKPFEFDD